MVEVYQQPQIKNKPSSHSKHDFASGKADNDALYEVFKRNVFRQACVCPKVSHESEGDKCFDDVEDGVGSEQAHASKVAHEQNDFELVEKILVSDISLNKQEEVLIMLKKSVLPDTEIRIKKCYGVVSVSVITKSKKSHLLLLNQLDDFKNYLTKSLEYTAEVNILYQPI